MHEFAVFLLIVSSIFCNTSECSGVFIEKRSKLNFLYFYCFSHGALFVFFNGFYLFHLYKFRTCFVRRWVITRTVNAKGTSARSGLVRGESAHVANRGFSTSFCCMTQKLKAFAPHGVWIVWPYLSCVPRHFNFFKYVMFIKGNKNNSTRYWLLIYVFREFEN